jgi:hypothetical protein
MPSLLTERLTDNMTYLSLFTGTDQHAMGRRGRGGGGEGFFFFLE